MHRIGSWFARAPFAAALACLLALAALPGGVSAQGPGLEAVPFGADGYQYKQVAWGAEVGFEQPGYDTTGWGTGTAPFGSPNTCGFAFVTPWSPNTDLLVRKAFPLPPGATNVRITGTIDNDATVYLNGTQVAPTVLSGSCQSGAIDLAVDDALLAADGNNLLAIRGHDFGVSTMLDVQVTFDDGPAYDICTLYDATKAHKAGATVPLKLQLCDGGVNLSDPSIVVHATGVYLSDADPAETVVEDAGNANPDQDFRYDADLGGYIYNLKTTGLTPGTWAVGFTVDGEVDPSYVVTFDVK